MNKWGYFLFENVASCRYVANVIEKFLAFALVNYHWREIATDDVDSVTEIWDNILIIMLPIKAVYFNIYLIISREGICVDVFKGELTWFVLMLDTP